MTNHTPKRRPYTRRFRQVYVTTTRRERAPKQLARIITGFALADAQRESEARADHHTRLARNQVLDIPVWQPQGEGCGDA